MKRLPPSKRARAAASQLSRSTERDAKASMRGIGRGLTSTEKRTLKEARSIQRNPLTDE